MGIMIVNEFEIRSYGWQELAVLYGPDLMPESAGKRLSKWVFTVLLRAIHKIFRGKKGGQLGVGILVALLDIATANNTVAIVMANPIAKQMSEDYGITPRKTASLLDTFSCISQGILPYGAQMLVAISAVHELGYELSAFEIMANLFYPGMLLVSSLIFIFVLPDRKNAESNA